MAILAAMGKRKARGIGKASWRPMDDLGDHGECFHRSGSDTRRQQQALEIGWTALGRGRQIGMQTAHVNIALTDIVMNRHDEMRQRSLLHILADGWTGGLVFLQFDNLAHDSVQFQGRQKIKLPVPGLPRTTIGKIDDLALPLAFDSHMR